MSLCTQAIALCITNRPCQMVLATAVRRLELSVDTSHGCVLSFVSRSRAGKLAFAHGGGTYVVGHEQFPSRTLGRVAPTADLPAAQLFHAAGIDPVCMGFYNPDEAAVSQLDQPPLRYGLRQQWIPHVRPFRQWLCRSFHFHPNAGGYPANQRGYLI